MVFRAIGSGLFLTLGAIGSDRSAPSVWNIAFIGDFVIGTTALFLAYKVWKNHQLSFGEFYWPGTQSEYLIYLERYPILLALLFQLSRKQGLPILTWVGLLRIIWKNLATQLCPRATTNTSPAWPKTSLQPNCNVAFSYHSKHPYMSVI